MKLRIRLNKVTAVLSLDGDSENATVRELYDFTQTVFPEINNLTFQLSLNKKEPIENNDTKLSDLGIVSGDLIHVLKEKDQGPPIAGSANKEFLSNCHEGQMAGPSFAPQPGTSTNVDTQDSIHCIPDETSEPMAETHSESELLEASSSKETEEERLIKRKLLREPRLCRDSTVECVPALLEEVYSAFGVVSSSDALVVVQHVLMLEMGFSTVPLKETSASDVESESLDDEPLNKLWKSMGLYKIPYTHTGCEDLTCFVTSVPMGSMMVVHGFIGGTSNESSHKLQIRIADYIEYVPGKTDVASCYTNLPKFSRLFKDNIGLPLLQDLRSAKGLHCEVGLLGLVHEVKLQIMCYLDCKSVLAMSAVCREMYAMSRDPCIWRNLYIQQFGSLSRRNALSQDWFQLYKCKYKLEMEKREALKHMTFVTPPIGIGGRHNPPFPWVPVGPGIVGGDYDLTPNLPGMPSPLFQNDRRMRQRGPLVLSPRIDPLGPLPDVVSLPGRGRGGLLDSRRNFGGMGRQPRFF